MNIEKGRKKVPREGTEKVKDNRVGEGRCKGQTSDRGRAKQTAKRNKVGSPWSSHNRWSSTTKSIMKRGLPRQLGSPCGHRWSLTRKLQGRVLYQQTGRTTRSVGEKGKETLTGRQKQKETTSGKSSPSNGTPLPAIVRIRTPGTSGRKRTRKKNAGSCARG